ncbi:MAG: aromatic ring-hydroxylating dioxygenase subunit alpha [Gammaproteobacteria bacterium]|nr:aromatic ring-hydroxylating dioxygenase subunit alpha [Gammaproteobacteria bacterium]
MYINFWYPICKSTDLGDDAPLSAQVLGTRLVAFRDSDSAPHVLSNTCVHRGGSLSKGLVKDDCLVCPYHGWRYAGDGKCQLIPSFGDDSKIPARAKIDSYPVQEKYGILFAFLGDLPAAERPPLYEIENYDSDAWRAAEPVILELNAYYERSMENGLDPMHNEFVHPAQGNVSPILESLKITSANWGHELSIKMGVLNPDQLTLTELQGRPEDLGATSAHHGPNTLITSIDLAADNNFTQYFFEQPVNDSQTRIFFVNTRNCLLEPQQDDRIQEVNLRVAGEDIGVIEALYPVRTPETTTKELLATGEGCIVGFRKLLKEWEQRGWRVDLAALRENEGDIAYAIPSPGRRKSGNWVLDPIPLMPGADG